MKIVSKELRRYITALEHQRNIYLITITNEIASGVKCLFNNTRSAKSKTYVGDEGGRPVVNSLLSKSEEYIFLLFYYLLIFTVVV